MGYLVGITFVLIRDVNDRAMFKFLFWWASDMNLRHGNIWFQKEFVIFIPSKTDSTHLCLLTQLVSAWYSIPRQVPKCISSGLKIGSVVMSCVPIFTPHTNLTVLNILIWMWCCFFVYVATMHRSRNTVHIWFCPSQLRRPNPFPAFWNYLLRVL